MRICTPVAGPITGYFGDTGPWYTNAWGYHLGIDVGAPEGEAVVAARMGTVLYCDDAGVLGLTVVLEHRDHQRGRSRSVYSHLSQFDVRLGQRVVAGQQLGRVGWTGTVSPPGPAGSHLHLECWVRCAPAPVGAHVTPYLLTRDDPTALPADPAVLWQGGWPTAMDGRHTPGFTG